MKRKKHLKADGMIWISWPKKSSGVSSDLDENIIRNYRLKVGLIDIKVCAVNKIWSALKLVIPVKDRKKQSFRLRSFSYGFPQEGLPPRDE